MRYGNIGLGFCNKFGGDAWLCRVSAAVYGCINIWNMPLQSCLKPLKRAYLLGLGTGDIEYALLNASLYYWNSFDSLPLNVLESGLRSLADRMAFLGQDASLMGFKPTWQMCLNFLGRHKGDPKVLKGQALTQDDLNNVKLFECFYRFLRSVDMYCLILAYHFADFKLAESCLVGSATVYKNMNTLGAACCRLYHALTLLATIRRGNYSGRIRHVRRHLKVMRQWSKTCPENFLGKQFLVEAELAKVLNDNVTAKTKYYLAIIQSRDAGILMQEALANERAGKFYLSIGEQTTAVRLLEEACRLYKVWGGVAKLDHLKQEIGHMFL